MKKLFLILFITINIYANEFEFNEDFNSFLENESEIATKSKLNIDYAPSIITILKAETLEKLGAKDLFEALAFIPGIDVNRARHGEEDLNIRGTFSVYYGGKYKFLINDIPITQLLTHDIFPYLPIEQISRIEVIRGPGSSLYGESAFNGVINIVTKKDENKLFFNEEFYSLNRHGKIGGGSLFFEEGGLKINILASQNKNDGDKIISNNMLVENLENHHYSLIDLSYKNTNFTLINSSTRYGSFNGFGDSFISMVEYDGKENGTNKTSIASLKQKIHLSDNLCLNLMAYYSNIDNIASNITIFKAPLQDYKMDMFYKEEQSSLNFDFHYELKNHTILAGYYYKNIKKDKNYKKFNFNPITFQPIINQPEILIEDTDNERINRAIYIQDIYKATDKLSLTFGVRSDKYSDIKDSITPKIAGVYEIDKENLLKAQFAKAFRTPSFNEKYNVSFPISYINNIDNEVINTYELAYILNKPTYSFKTNFFYSKLKNLIFLDVNNISSVSYSNKSNANSKGFEIEFIKNYGENLTLNSNLSYSEAKYKNINISNIDNFMFNLALFIKPYSTSSLSIWYKYINENVKEVSNKHDLRNYHIINLNFEKTFIVNDNTLTARIGVKNLFDSEYRYFDKNNLNLQANGRSIWAGISYEF